MKEIALTTIDNPYSPFTEFDEWLNYDLEKGYNCCGYIDRVKQVFKKETSYLSNEEENRIIDDVIDYIVQTDPTGNFVKVEKTAENGKNGRNFVILAKSAKNGLLALK